MLLALAESHLSCPRTARAELGVCAPEVQPEPPTKEKNVSEQIDENEEGKTQDMEEEEGEVNVWEAWRILGPRLKKRKQAMGRWMCWLKEEYSEYSKRPKATDSDKKGETDDTQMGEEDTAGKKRIEDTKLAAKSSANKKAGEAHAAAAKTGEEAQDGKPAAESTDKTPTKGPNKKKDGELAAEPTAKKKDNKREKEKKSKNEKNKKETKEKNEKKETKGKNTGKKDKTDKREEENAGIKEKDEKQGKKRKQPVAEEEEGERALSDGVLPEVGHTYLVRGSRIAEANGFRCTVLKVTKKDCSVKFLGGALESDERNVGFSKLRRCGEKRQPTPEAINVKAEVNGTPAAPAVAPASAPVATTTSDAQVPLTVPTSQVFAGHQ